MPRHDPDHGCVCFKVVLCGPGEGGKTTALRTIHADLDPATRGRLVTLSTGTGRTLYFDFLPVDAGFIPQLGQPARMHLFTVPGQLFYDNARRRVLDSADGLLFVADSAPDRQDLNRTALADIESLRSAAGPGGRGIPLVFLYNKRDLADAVSVGHLRQQLNGAGLPEFEAVARTGQGVQEALECLCRRMVADHVQTVLADTLRSRSPAGTAAG